MSSTFQEALLSPKIAAQFLIMTENRLAKYRLTGDGPTFIKLGRRIYYRVSDIEAWIEKNRYSSTSQYDQMERD